MRSPSRATWPQRGQRFDVIFLDPPYQQDFLSQAMPLCASLLKPGGLVYAESGERLPFAEQEGRRKPPDWLAGWELVSADKAGMVSLPPAEVEVALKQGFLS
jgi:16S rRNA (guanine966-N2)-methyltransferase